MGSLCRGAPLQRLLAPAANEFPDVRLQYQDTCDVSRALFDFFLKNLSQDCCVFVRFLVLPPSMTFVQLIQLAPRTTLAIGLR